MERTRKVEDFYVPRPRQNQVFDQSFDRFGNTFDRVFGSPPSPRRARSIEHARTQSGEATRASSVEIQNQRAGRTSIPQHNPPGSGRGIGRSRSAERTRSEVSVFTSKEPEQDLHQMVQKRHFDQKEPFHQMGSALSGKDVPRDRTPSPGAEGRRRMQRSSSVPSVGCMSARSSREYTCVIHGGYQVAKSTTNGGYQYNEYSDAPFKEVQRIFRPETYSGRPQRGATEHRVKEDQEHASVAKSLFSDQCPPNIYVPGKRQFGVTCAGERRPEGGMHKNFNDSYFNGALATNYKQRLKLQHAQCNARRRQSSCTSTQEPRSVLDRSNGLVEKLVGDRQHARRGLTLTPRSVGMRCGDATSAPCSARRGSTGGYAASRLWRP